jgi:cytoskeletal protein CcmA (bactofilin family)
MEQPKAGAGKQTIVEEGSHFKGSLVSTCPVLVNGRIEGDVETPSLSVSPTGSVKGKAKVGEVQSQGEIEGEFDAETVRIAGRVRDNTVIRAKTLEVKLASETSKMQVIFGECEISAGDAPNDDAKKGKKKGPSSEAPPGAEGAG